MSHQRAIKDLVGHALSLAASSVGDLAAEIGVSREAVHSWAAGLRKPTEENRKRLIEVLRRRGEELQQLADELAGRS